MRRRTGMVQERGRWVPFTWLDPVAASPTEVAAGSLLVVVLGLVGLVWGAAALSTLLIRGQSAGIGVSDAAVAMVRMGSNRLQWEGAWDPAVEADLAGPRWFWLVFGAEAFVVGLLFWPAWRLFGPRPGDPLPVIVGKSVPLHPRAERRREVREAAAPTSVPAPARDLARAVAPEDRGSLEGVADKILIGAPDGRRLVLGRVGRSLVATESHHSVIVFGPTQTGKTSALSVPALLEWRGPALVCTAKADVVTLTWDPRTDRGGQSWLVDPMATMKRPASGPGSRHRIKRYSWSPLEVMEAVPRLRHELDGDRRYRQWALARRTAQWMVRAVAGPAGGAAGAAGSGPEDRLAPAQVVAEQLLAPLLLAAVAEEQAMAQVGEWLDQLDHTSVADALARTGVSEAMAAWEGTRLVDPALDVAARRLLAVALYSYRDPAVAQNRDPAVDWRQLFDGRPNTLYLLAPPQHGERLRPLLSTLVTQVTDAALGQATASADGRLAQPLLVVFDDAISCVPTAVMDQLAGAGAGVGIQVLTLFGDLAQMERAFGRVEAAQMANSHRARVLLPGITDGATLNYVTGLIRGNRLLVPGADETLTGEAMVSASANWLRTLEDGQGLCVYGNLPPLRMSLRPWYDEPGLRNLVQPGPAQDHDGARQWLRRRAPTSGGVPDPLDSEANNQEAELWWQAVLRGDELPDTRRPYDDGSAGGPLVS